MIGTIKHSKNDHTIPVDFYSNFSTCVGHLQRPTNVRPGQRAFTVQHVLDAINKVKMAELRDVLLVLHAKDRFATSE